MKQDFHPRLTNPPARKQILYSSIQMGGGGGEEANGGLLVSYVGCMRCAERLTGSGRAPHPLPFTVPTTPRLAQVRNQIMIAVAQATRHRGFRSVPKREHKENDDPFADRSNRYSVKKQNELVTWFHKSSTQFWSSRGPGAI